MSHLQSEDYLVGGVTSGWNYFCESGRTIVGRAAGPRLWDRDGRQYIDWIMGWGSLLLGHDPRPVMDAVRESFELGFGFQYETETHAELAREICVSVPGADKVRLANSGTEATLHALRIARKVTGRRKILKFEGHFHGVNDYLLFGVDSGPRFGELTADGAITPVAGSEGLPDEALGDLVLIAPFNNLDAVAGIFAAHGQDLAGVILEPIALNVGCIAPDPGFLAGLRQLCDRFGVVLIFDEVLTGFRVARGGAQELYGVRADVTCLGKALGCGMPVAAVAGRREVMDVLTPVGPVQMAGTNTGRHMTVRGTLAAVRALSAPGFHDGLRGLNDRTVAGCRELFARYGVPAYVEGYGGRIGVHIGSEERPRDFREVVRSWNREYYTALYRELYGRLGLFGFLLPLGICPEAVTLSAAHGPDVIDETLNRLETALRAVPYRAAEAERGR